MFYNLLYPLADQVAFFNLFKYLTFRTGGAVVTAMVIAFLAGPAVIRWLMLSVCLHAVQFPFADALTGLGRQPLRTGLVTGALLLNVGLNLWWIPRWGWRGAAAATVLCDAILAVALVVAVLLVPRREAPPGSSPGADGADVARWRRGGAV